MISRKWHSLKGLPEQYSYWTRHGDVFSREGHLDEKSVELSVMQVRLLFWHDRKSTYLFIRNYIDKFLALMAVVVFSPLLLAIALAIKATTKGPIFYKQIRLGQFGRPFWIWKFRTMSIEADSSLLFAKPLQKTTNDHRVTGLGKILRNYKLDELPQLWNVLKGEMAVIGPRPLSIQDCLSVQSRFNLRYALRPGLSGMWQAFWSTESEPEAKLLLDCVYVRKFGPLLDIKLLLATIPRLIRGERGLPLFRSRKRQSREVRRAS